MCLCQVEALLWYGRTGVHGRASTKHRCAGQRREMHADEHGKYSIMIIRYNCFDFFAIFQELKISVMDKISHGSYPCSRQQSMH